MRFIYRSFLQGYSDTEIGKQLMEMGVPAPCGGQTWHASVVGYMLLNEKMKGDALIQKSYTADFLDRRRKNRGEVPQYQKQDHLHVDFNIHIPVTLRVDDPVVSEIICSRMRGDCFRIVTKNLTFWNTLLIDKSYE